MSQQEMLQQDNGLDIVKKQGFITPVIHLWSLYLGSHGTSEYTASFQIFIEKARFVQKLKPELDFDFESGEKDLPEED